MNAAVLAPSVQLFIQKHSHVPPAEVALAKSPFSEVHSRELAQQIQGRNRIQKKLPLWYNTPLIYYPPLLALEQCSSQQAAQHKADLIPKHNRSIDLTGGFGVDTYFIAKQGEYTLHCERQETLACIAAHNLKTLGANHIGYCQGDGLYALQQADKNYYDFAFIDPSRRKEGQKVFTLESVEPNIIQAQDMINCHVGQWMMKAAPLLDIQGALRSLKYVRWVEVVSIGNEVKELLFFMQRDWMKPAQIRATRLSNGIPDTFSFYWEEETQAVPSYALPGTYLYEPDVALMKAGCFNLVSQRLALQKLHPNTHLYTGNIPQINFPGKTFEVLESRTYGQFKKHPMVDAASIVTRNFPIKAEQLRRNFQLKEHSEQYLFFFKDYKEGLSVVFAKRLP